MQQFTVWGKKKGFFVTNDWSLFFVAVLNEQMKEAEGSFTEYEKEIEELKELLPEIREKIEDAKESQQSGNVAELALKATLVCWVLS